MLSDSSYHTALYVYLGSALLLTLYMGWWLRQHWRPVWVLLFTLLLAVVLLTPAYPREGVATLAPAVIVAAFQYITVGPEGAAHALRPLIAIGGISLVVTLILQITVLRRYNKSPAHEAKTAPQAKNGRHPQATDR